MYIFYTGNSGMPASNKYPVSVMTRDISFVMLRTIELIHPDHVLFFLAE